MKQFILPDDVRGLLLSYLITRPYMEVEGGVKMLRELKELPESPPQGSTIPSDVKPKE